MFGLFATTRRSSQPVVGRRARLQVEALETRYCPTPTIKSFLGNELPNGWYQFSGQVSDVNPAVDFVAFKGFPSVNGKTTPVHANGSFSLLVHLNHGDGGIVSATAFDLNLDASNVAYWDVLQTGGGGTGGTTSSSI
jgi:hypothetical protein